MKNSSLKKILSVALFSALILTVIFVITSCHVEHVYDSGCDKECNECGEIRTEIVHDLETVTGYDPTCTEDGCRAYEKCKNCDYSTHSIEHLIHATGHTEGAEVKENVVAPTCTEQGSYDSVYYCVDCGEEVRRSTYPDAALDHDIKTAPAQAATCSDGWYEYEYCTRCNYSTKKDNIISPVYEHIISKYAVEYTPSRVDSTCTETGYYYTAFCCTNDNCTYMLGDYCDLVVIPIKDHVPDEAVNENIVKATCTKNGSYDKVIYCKNCETELSRSNVPLISPGHKIVTVDAQAETCTEIGWNAHEYCTVCDYTTREDIPATNHDGGASIVTVDAKAPTCTEIGWEAYEYCTVCDYSTYEEKEALHHSPDIENMDEPYPEEYFVIENLVEPTCTETGSYDRVIYCGTCGVELRRENWIVPEVAHNMVIEVPAKAPTCDEPGNEAYVCCSKCGYPEDEYVIPALGHQNVEHTEAKEATCTEDGNKEYWTCKTCNVVFADKDYKVPTTVEAQRLPALEHDVVVLPAVAPTCTEDGLTEGSYCKRCDDKTVKQNVDPATGHDYDANGYCQNSGCSERISVGLSFELNSDGGYTFTGVGSCTDTEIVIPSEVNGVPVTAIAAEALYNNSSVKSVVIPDSVKTVGEEAFFYCDSLESVVIGNGVEEIGAFAFFYCESLTSVTVGSSVKSIGNGAFNYCPISVVYYHGTAAQWNGISIAGNNSDLTGANREYI